MAASDHRSVARDPPAPSDGSEAGRSLVRQIAKLITRTAAEQTVPFGLVADAGDSIVVMLHDRVAMTLTPSAPGEEGSEVVSGADSMTWVDRLVHSDFESLVLAAPGHASSSPITRLPKLAAGISKGAAIQLVTGALADVPAQAPSQFLSISLSRADVSSLMALPRLGEEAAPAPAADAVVAAKLLLPDGTAVPVGGGLLLGREPHNAPEVADGSMSAFALPDADRGVSRVHARVAILGESVTIEDLGSSNGTALAAPETAEWTALIPHEPVSLAPGTRIRIGGQELTFIIDPESSREPPPPAVKQPAAGVSTLPVESRVGQEDGVGDYVFVRSLGAGDRGAYFLAIPPARLQLDAEFVAVKVFRGATSDDAFRRATRELRAFAAAESQYLIKVHDAGQDKGQLFYSMDYIGGGSLAEPAVPLDQAGIIKAVAQAARAAHALHEVGVVHQAIMPKNILMGEGKAYLADLGLAQLISQDSFATSLGDFEGLEFLDPSVLTSSSRSTEMLSRQLTPPLWPRRLRLSKSMLSRLCAKL